MSVGKKKKEPLFHIVKRDALPWQKTWLIRVGAIAAALIVCALLTVFLTHENPISVYATIRSAFGIFPPRQIIQAAVARPPIRT